MEGGEGIVLHFPKSVHPTLTVVLLPLPLHAKNYQSNLNGSL